MIGPKSLQQRFTLFILLPLATMLFGMGFIGFTYARKSLLEQWTEAYMLMIERAAQQVDKRLDGPKVLLKLYYATSGKPGAGYVRENIIQQLGQMEGVINVTFTAYGQSGAPQSLSHGVDEQRKHSQSHPAHAFGGSMIFHRAKMLGITPPRYDSQTKNNTVSIISDFKDQQGKPVGRLDVVLGFDYLMGSVLSPGWGPGHSALLVDYSGKVLAGSTAGGAGLMLGENHDFLELKILEAMGDDLYGTVMGEGYPPTEVGGFYHLEEAPWYLVMIAPGNEILSPIMTFRNYYLLTGLVFILFILFLVRFVTSRTISEMKRVTQAARQVAKGEYRTHLVPRTRDEVGELIENFNSMAVKLEERMQMKRALELAKDVQQNLLPKANPSVPGLDIAGKSIYCDETGGDYYDFFIPDTREQTKISVVVGDVSGHGISSALLMATTRAILRQHSSSGRLDSLVSGANRQIVKDVEDSGSFVTLFYVDIDTGAHEIAWVRAGHDAAFIFDPYKGSFLEFSGKGLPLGVLEDAEYHETTQPIHPGQVVIIGTDGIWETRHPDGNIFGKQAFKETIRTCSHLSATEMIDAVIEELQDFRYPEKQEDDITLVIIKIEV